MWIFLLRIFLYSEWIREYTDQKKSVLGYFSRSVDNTRGQLCSSCAKPREGCKNWFCTIFYKNLKQEHKIWERERYCLRQIFQILRPLHLDTDIFVCLLLSNCINILKQGEAEVHHKKQKKAGENCVMHLEKDYFLLSP